MASKDWYPSLGFSRRNDSAFASFVTSVGKRVFGLFGKYFYFNGASIKNTVQTLLSVSNAIAVDASLGNIWYHLLTENTTIGAPTNMVAGTVYTLILKQDTSTRTFAFNAVFLIDSAYTLSTGSGAIDTLMFYCDGTNLLELSRTQALATS